jgi:hypothetical protein
MSEATGYQINFVGWALGVDSKKVWPDADPVSRLIFRRLRRLSQHRFSGQLFHRRTWRESAEIW